MKKFLLAIPISIALFSIGVVTAYASSSNWPTLIKSHSWDGQPGRKGPFAIGTLISPVLLRGEGGVQSQTYRGDTGWAYATLDHYLYPIVSRDHGRSWHIGGIYFAVPIAKPLDYITSAKIFSPSVVAFYASGSETFDITSDAGHHWSQTFFPGLIRAVTNSGSSIRFPEGVIKVEVQSGPNSISLTRFYISGNGGLRWNLSPTK